VNWSSVFCMFGMALTRPPLTMGWRVAWTSSRVCAGRYFEQLLWQYSAIWQKAFLFSSNVTRFLDFFWKLPQFHTSKFRKGVRKHIEGVVGSNIWVLLEIYLVFYQWKNFENPLRTDKVIAMSLVYYFFGHSVVTVRVFCLLKTS